MYNKELEQMLHSDDFSDRVTVAECAYGAFTIKEPEFDITIVGKQGGYKNE